CDGVPQPAALGAGDAARDPEETQDAGRTLAGRGAGGRDSGAHGAGALPARLPPSFEFRIRGDAEPGAWARAYHRRDVLGRVRLSELGPDQLRATPCPLRAR